MSINVTPTEQSPTHHISLSDSEGSIGFVLTDSDGNPNARAVREAPQNRTAIQTREGAPKYSDMQWPYIPKAQTDWSQGRGSDDFEKNTAKYFDASRIDGMGDGLILGGQETYATGYRGSDLSMPGNMSWYGLHTTMMYRSRSFVASGSYRTRQVEAWIRRVGTPNGAVYAVLRLDSAGSPGAAIAQCTIPAASIPTDGLSALVMQPWDSVGVELTAGTTYHIVFYGHPDDTATNCFQIGCSSGTAKVASSTAASTWTNSMGTPHFRITDAEKPFKAHFFEYKGALYFATQYDDGTAGTLYLNGYRGACDANGSYMSYLLDGTKAWATNELAGCIVKILNGAASEDLQNWRLISTNTPTEAWSATAWNIAHDVLTDYVILGSNKFTKITGTGSDSLTYPVTDVKVANDIIYLAQGSRGGVIEHREFNNQGAWLDANSSPLTCWQNAGTIATLLQVVRDPISGPVLWRYYRNLVTSEQEISRQLAPKAWETALMSGVMICNNGTAWNEQVISNVTSSFTDTAVVKLEVADAFTTGIIASEAVTSIDVRYTNKIKFKISSSVALQAGDLQLLMDNTALCASPTVTLNLPAIAPNQWTTVTLDYDASATAGADAIISVGLRLTRDPGAVTIQLLGAIWGYQNYEPIVVGETGERVTGLEVYGDPERLWVLTDTTIGQVENDIYTSVPLREMRSVKSEDNGRAHFVGDVFLYFSMGQGLERYYSQNLQDIGPNKGTGLPADRRGVISCGLSYPGRIIVGIDGGTDNYSSILQDTGTGWHEIYRAPRKGLRIRNIYVQPIPGNTVDRLWISMGSDILWVPISLNPYYDTGYRYTHEGYLISPWIDYGMASIRKLFKSIKVVADNLQSDYNTVRIDYKLDGAAAWSAIDAEYNVSPEDEHNLSSQPISGRKIQYRIRLLGAINTQTPKVKAVVLEGYGSVPVLYQYSWTTKVSEGDLSIDLEGDEDNTYSNVEAIIELLKSWSANMTPLTMNSVYSPYDNKIVVLDTVATQPLSVTPDEQQEEEIVTIVVKEV